MASNNVYNERLHSFCSKCEWWSGYACRKGHLLTAPTGCPIRKFEPVNGAGYDPDRLPEPLLKDMPSCCGKTTDMPDLSWTQVLAMFAQSMLKWAKAGLPIVPEKTHADRLRKCDICEHKLNFWCKKCKCVCYLKTKVATEQCPDNRWLKL